MRTVTVALLLVGLVGIAGCKKPGQGGDGSALAAAQAEAPAGAVPVRFAKVAERKLPPTLEVSGSLAADETSEVAAPGPGVVLKVEVDVGSRVKRGDPLVLLDPRDPSLKLQQANASTAQAAARLGVKPGEAFDPKKVADVRAAKEAMDLAEADAARTKSLFESGSVAQASWDQARTRAESARAQYDAALNGAQQAWAMLAAAQASAGLAQKGMADAVIRAPFDGAVAERRITAGEYCQTGRVVAVVVHDNPLRLKVDIPEGDAGRLALGQDVILSVAAFPGRIFHGTVKRVGASVKAQSRTLPVEAEVANDAQELKPGYFARAEVVLGGAPTAALLVPRAAIGETGTASRVFVRVAARVSERIVTLGRESDGLVVVRGTLGAADEIAVEGVDKLSDGAEISVLP